MSQKRVTILFQILKGFRQIYATPLYCVYIEETSSIVTQ